MNKITQVDVGIRRNSRMMTDLEKSMYEREEVYTFKTPDKAIAFLQSL